MIYKPYMNIRYDTECHKKYTASIFASPANRRRIKGLAAKKRFAYRESICGREPADF